MAFSTKESDYLIELLTTHLFTLLSRVTRWQTHSLSQAQYDRQVGETLTPNVKMLQSLLAKLTATAGDQEQLAALKAGLTKLAAAQTYQLTPEQLAMANERRLSRHRR